MEKTNSTFRRVYDETTYFIDSIVQEYQVFPHILQMMRDGNATIELKKRYMLRAIDEAWVNAIEDTLPSLDILIRNPSKFIEEREEVLPIELSHNISIRSLQHLAQHTNLISKIEGDKITPSKILNVFREETLQTYENRFLNTLINRLFAFVNRRYEIAAKMGQDEISTSLDFHEQFRHERTDVKIQFKVEISESSESESEKAERNFTKTTSLWKRVERLNRIVTAYTTSEFVQNMGHSYIRPPVMRTNAILKNKNLRQCLALWQFIESYEDAGYGMLVQENLEKVDDTYVKELYETLALQYLIFRYNIHNEFDADSTVASQTTDDVFRPRLIEELTNAFEHEFDITDVRSVPMPAVERYATLTPEDRLMLESLDVALDAAELLTDREAESFIPGEIHDPEPVPVPEVPQDETSQDAEETASDEKPEKDSAIAPSAEKKQTEGTQPVTHRRARIRQMKSRRHRSRRQMRRMRR